MSLTQVMNQVHNLGKVMQAKVDFANFANNHGIPPVKLGQLCQMVTKRAKLAMHYANVQMDQKLSDKYNATDDKLIAQIVELGKELGFGIEFPSCYPSVTDKDGRGIFLPL